MEYESVIGLEVHAQLKTASKVFCGCSTRFGAPPNSQVCPVCLGLPGVLPVLNRRAVEFTLRLALALGSEIAPLCRFARKNYFYPDLPKGYQISQYELPLARGGGMEVVTDGGRTRVGFHRVHMEEDAGKLIHGGELDDPSSSYVDLNRAGVPLLEIVTAPDLRSPAEASDFLQQLRTLLLYLEISDGNMEEGSMRCDANVSIRPAPAVRPAGERELGTKVEVKNLNSFRFVRRALEYEVERQKRVLGAGGSLVQETRLWDAAQGVTTPMRTKEFAHDYRYFPEPDLVPLAVGREWQERVRGELPELPLARRDRFVTSYGLPDYDAGILTGSPALADYFEEAVRLGAPPKAASNWVMGDVLRVLNERKVEPPDCPVSPRHLAGMLKLLEEGVISGKIAKAVFEEMAASGQMPEEVVRAKGLTQVTDEAAIESAVERVLAEHAAQVAEYRAGKEKLFGFFVGQTMKATGGKANPAAVQEILRKKLGG